MLAARDYSHMCKEVGLKPCVRMEAYKEDPKMQYFLSCKQNAEPPLNLF